MNCYTGGMHGPKFGDLGWINEQIDKLPINLQTGTRENYSAIYTELLESDVRQSRYRSNTWLRKFVKKHGLKVDNSNLMF